MKEIPLTQGKVALVNDDVYEWASEHKWFAHKHSSGKFYAARKGGRVYLHREIMGLKAGDKRQVDHRDGDTLNCNQENLRVCSQAENTRAFRTPYKNVSSPFRGVSWDSQKGKWLAGLENLGKFHYLGRFVDEESAARAYDKAACEIFGEFASTNFPLQKS